ncbi:MAG: hypothetical protein ACOH13_12605 [Flavobacteriales bacterium]
MRLVGLLFLGLSASTLQAKECVRRLVAYVTHADGTTTQLTDWSGTLYLHENVTLASGDTLILTIGLFDGGGWCQAVALNLTGSSLQDTATYASPLAAVNIPGQGVIKITQTGSYYAWISGADWGGVGNLFVTGAPAPVAASLVFTTGSAVLGVVASGGTCADPCISKNLQQNQFVRMQPIFGNMVLPGGNAVVRHAPEGMPLDLNSPATVVPMSDFEGYSFSEDGVYLLSVEGPYITSSTFAYVHITNIPDPRLDMRLTIERADGSTEEVAYLQPGGVSSQAVQLEAGDSLRVGHQAITTPCDSVRLHIKKSTTWGPPVHLDPEVDTASTSAGIRMVAPGSYFLHHTSSCGVLATAAYLTINAPAPQLDLVVGVVNGEGMEDELFRNHVVLDPPPHLEANLVPGDSVRVHFEGSGWCGLPNYIQIYRSSGAQDATVNDPAITWGMGYVNDISFVGNGNYLIKLRGGICYPEQLVHLHDGFTPIPGIDLQVERLEGNGTAYPIAYAEASGPLAYAEVELGQEDSIRVRAIEQQGSCADLRLKGYLGIGDTATVSDPVFLDQAMDLSEYAFRQLGSLLLVLEDTCGVPTASVHISVSEPLFTAVVPVNGTGFNAWYADGTLNVDALSGGLLQIRNMAGQLLQEEELAPGAGHKTMQLKEQAGGMYLATLVGAVHVDVFRFMVY